MQYPTKSNHWTTKENESTPSNHQKKTSRRRAHFSPTLQIKFIYPDLVRATRRTFQFHPGERTSRLSIIFDHLTVHNEWRCNGGRRLVTVSYQECRLPAWFSCCANISIYRMYRADRSSRPHRWLETPTVIVRVGNRSIAKRNTSAVSLPLRTTLVSSPSALSRFFYQLRSVQRRPLINRY